jgi:hypothetical protein
LAALSVHMHVHTFGQNRGPTIHNFHSPIASSNVPECR